MVKPPPPEPAASPPSPAQSRIEGRAGADIGRQIGERLRSMFDDVLTEPVPERFRRLLEDLERASSTAPGSDAPASDTAAVPPASS